MNELNFKLATVFVALVVALFFTGCASQQKGPSDAYRAANDVSYAASEWTNQRSYHRAVIGLEEALENYEGESFTQSTLTVLALVHLERGNHEEFLDTVERLEATVEHRQYLSPQAQHVLTVAGAMNGTPRSSLPGRGYDSAHGRTVYALMGVKE